MKMRDTCVAVAFGVLGVLVAAEQVPAWARADESTLIIVPARPKIIQLAFDMAAMRPMTVLSYRGDAKSAEPLLHQWTGSEWRYVSFEDFRENRGLFPTPSKVIVVGDDRTVPPSLLQSMPWLCDVARIQTLQLAPAINQLDAIFHFKDREWQVLANHFDLNLEDVNADRRNRNPYDVPRSQWMREHGLEGR